ncbi:MAG: TetR/AcrR family transcriptional regulator [Proteiniphilum sp.]|nr:TetR/AcrR family transcriptional regulator [Proteiniphilum sp.]
MLKERILEKAGTKFYQYGIKNVSMNDLASSLGISKRTLYENFQDKEDILRQYLENKRDKNVAKIKELINKSANIIEVFIYFIDCQQKVEMPSVKFYQDIEKYYPTIHQEILNSMESNKSYMKSALQQGIKDGFIREGLNVEVAAFLVEESNHTYLRASYIKKPTFSFQDLFFTMMINFIRGISTNKGIEIIDKYLENSKNEKNQNNI